ncbi:MAG: YceI family protein [Bacteroidales bacterium]
MKKINRALFGKLFVVMVMLAPLAAISQTTYSVKSHEVTIEGTSNIQDWTAKVENVKGTLKLAMENGKISGIQETNIIMDAESIKGSEGRRMDSKIYDALDARSNPQITFLLRDVQSLEEKAGSMLINATGVLTIGGVSREISLDTPAKVLANGSIELSGKHQITMSDHRIEPPTALFGALKTGDLITVTYKVVMAAI